MSQEAHTWVRNALSLECVSHPPLETPTSRREAYGLHIAHDRCKHLDRELEDARARLTSLESERA